MGKFFKIDKLFFISILIGAMILSSCSKKPDSTGTPGEMKMKSKWVKEHLLNADPQLPFSFIYDGKASSELLKTWPKKTETVKLDSNRTQYTHIWTDEKTGLEVRCIAVEYSDYSVAEWTIYFKNTGTNNTPILKDIQGLNVMFRRGPKGEFVLHHNRGDFTTKDSYAPFTDSLVPMMTKRFAPSAGKPTGGAFPYFNLQMPEGGVIIAVGWPGQWASSFDRDDKNGLHIVAGQELTNLYLKPGEEIRTPLITFQFWEGMDIAQAQNLWRRWMIVHNMPRTKDGKPPAPQLYACSSHFYGEMTKADEASQKMFIDGYLSKGIKLDYWWMDAGWYPCEGNWGKTGTWEVDTKRFPNGLRAVSDYAHAKDVKIIVWFEPERVGDANTWLGQNHPEWLLDGKILNLGNTDALKWATDHFSKLITDEGIDLYRQDYNIDPLRYWRKNDTSDRQGITENLYVQGYLAYLDGLIARHPGMLIDMCAGGGQRNDPETMRRAIPLLRSDYIIEPVGQQGHTYGLSSWIPYYGTGLGHMWGGENIYSAYDFRSCMTPGPILCYDVRPEVKGDFALVAKLCEQWHEVSPAMLGDYYPLLPYSIAGNAWLAWQFDRPGQSDGFVQAFRRDKCDEPVKTFSLRGLNPAAQYEVTNVDVQGSTKFTGKELIEKGLTVEIKDKPGAAVIIYKESK